MKKQSEVDGIRELLTELNVKTHNVKLDKRASPYYWSGGDSFGSIQDIRDAEDWVENEVAAWFLAALRRRGWRKTVKRATKQGPKKGRGK